MVGRTYTVGQYRFGYNSHEKDNEVAGVGNHMSFGGYGLDTRLGRRWNIDPQGYRMPGQSPYSVNNNSPISHYDPDGEFAQFILQYGINVGINVMTQMVTAYMLDPNVNSWGEAWDKTSMFQAFGEGVTFKGKQADKLGVVGKTASNSSVTSNVTRRSVNKFTGKASKSGAKSVLKKIIR